MGELTSFCSDPLSRILLGDSAGFSGGTKEAMPARRKEAPSAAAGSSSKSPAASPKLAPKKAKGSKAKSAAKKPVEVHRCRFVEWVPYGFLRQSVPVQVARFSYDSAPMVSTWPSRGKTQAMTPQALQMPWVAPRSAVPPPGFYGSRYARFALATKTILVCSSEAPSLLQLSSTKLKVSSKVWPMA